MKKIIFAVLIIIIIITTTILIINGNKKQNNNIISAQDYVPSGKYTDVRQELPLIKYDGFYGDEYSANASVFFVNENTVDIDFNIYRTGGFSAKNVKIDKNGIGRFSDYYGDISNGIVIFENGKITIEATDEEENELLKDEEGKQLSLEKKSTEVLTEKELNAELQKALNDFNNINTDIFEIENGTKYITLSLKPTCYIMRTYEFEDESYKYYNLDEEGHYYTIDKDNKKYLTLQDLFPDTNRLNDYIANEIEKKKQNWKSLTIEYDDEDMESYTYTIDEWPYDDFEGIGEYDYFENYFKIDELSNTVSIRVLDYPYEAIKDLGEIWVDVPLTL